MSSDSIFSRIESILGKIGMSTLFETFKNEKIDEKVAVSLSDNELIRLGITTIGDRVRFRDLCQREINTSDSASTSSSASEQLSSVPRQTQRERAHLFNVRGSLRAGGSRLTPARKKEGRKRTWTGNFMCLADRLASRVPSADEKQILQKAGLGIKKITFAADDDEKAVVEKITCSDKVNSDTDETVGFPKLKNCGGFELMNCISNCRNLNILDCEWSVKSLKASIGGQSRIYIRPIQINLNTNPVVEDKPSELEEMCKVCRKHVLVRNMRTHSTFCVEEFLQVSSEGEGETTVNESPSSELQIDSSTTQAELAGVHTIQAELVDVSTEDLLPNEAITPIAESGAPSFDNIAEAVAKHCSENEIVDSVEILRCFQKEIVTGRELDVSDPTQVCEGLTNYILVDRANILLTSLDEIKDITDLRPTLQVEFYGECAEDYGGPRKEFFRLVLNAIKDKYFDKGLRDHLCEDYEPVGIIMGLSIIQNGKIPQFMTEEIITEAFDNSELQPCVAKLRDGFARVGIFQMVKHLPVLKNIFNQTPQALTVKKIVHIYRPQFSEEGSNNLTLEKSIYSAFMKYIREVASVCMLFLWLEMHADFAVDGRA
ncbi:leucine-rich repeat-containing DDB_G0290503 isoform X1, partial [Paramuricea clavata]